MDRSESFKAHLKGIKMKKANNPICKNTKNSSSFDSLNPVSKRAGSTRNNWVQYYAKRMLKAWTRRDCPLGISCDYSLYLKKYLTQFSDDPLKRAFIESTY